MKIKPFRVSEVNAYIRKIIFNNPMLTNIHIAGEVKGLKRTSSGYSFFDLTEGESIIKCISFGELPEFKEGEEIIAVGKIESYDKRSIYQLVVTDILDKSEGEDARLLNILKEKLERKGYFRADRKKKIPDFCKKIGIITSLEGAVIEDMMRVFREYNLDLDILLYDSNVQGRSAVFGIISGLSALNDIPDTDVIIIARGGGSKVDLSTFNDELLSDAIYASSVPVITGIGHGTDLSIADMTADMEFQTPTAAAEYILRNYVLLLHKIFGYPDMLNKKITEYGLRNKNYVKSLYRLFDFYDKDRIIGWRNYIADNKFTALNNEFRGLIRKKSSNMEYFIKKLSENNYQGIFDKGFVILEDSKGGMIKDISGILKGDNIVIRNMDISVLAEIKEKRSKNEDKRS